MNLKRILNLVGVLLLIALVVPFVIYAVPMTVGADHSFVVLTASMTPAIAPGDVVIVADRDPATIAEGDVITFTRPGNEVPVTHRVTTVLESSDGLAFETKGDANSDPDSSLVPAGNIVGTVILTIPYIGYVVQFTNTPHGFIALVAGPIGLFILSELWTLYRGRSVANGSLGKNAEPADPDATAASDDPNDGFAITVRTLEGALIPLVALVAYSGYTAYIRPTEVSVAVAVGSTISLIALFGLLVNARVGRDTSTADAVESTDDSGPNHHTTDGGIDRNHSVASKPSIGNDVEDGE